MTDPMETLRAHGWRVRTKTEEGEEPKCFVRRGECLWLAANGVWRWLRRSGAVRVAGRNLADAVWLACPRASLAHSGGDYEPIMEAVR